MFRLSGFPFVGGSFSKDMRFFASLLANRPNADALKPFCCSMRTENQKETSDMARGRTRVARRAWTTQDERELKKHSKSKTPVRAISRTMKRTPGALRQKARHLGIAIGHQPRKSTRRR